MANGDGDGWATCDREHRHWGAHGASGMLAVHHADDGPHVLLQKRSWWSHHGRTWGIPGGARDSHETSVESALREVAEETSLDPTALRTECVYTDDHGGWTFDTVVAFCATRPRVEPANGESSTLQWVLADEVPQLRLHPGLAETWPALHEGLRPLSLVLDAANIVGSRADGWWRDRAGATARLISAIGTRMPYGWRDGPFTWFPRVTMVVEGAARDVEGVPGVEVVAAPRSGDDAIVSVAGSRDPREKVLVITADRELRARCTALGASTAGPRWVLDRI